jgi:hypothetical protein
MTITSNAVGQVFTTTNYDLFKSIDGNRTINKLHLKRLKKSMEANYLLSPILVNENYQIIDGQHRYQAAKELKLPIYYMVIDGYGLKEVQILNATSKKWNADDYLNGYIDMGLKDYILYKQYKEKYGFGHNECMRLLSGGRPKGTQSFYDGTFKINHLNRANKIGDYIIKLLAFYAGAKRRSFINAVATIWINKNFDKEYFLSQVEKYRSMLFDCPSTSAYIEIIENIYNYRKRNKTNLRF